MLNKNWIHVIFFFHFIFARNGESVFCKEYGESVRFCKEKGESVSARWVDQHNKPLPLCEASDFSLCLSSPFPFTVFPFTVFP